MDGTLRGLGGGQRKAAEGRRTPGRSARSCACQRSHIGWLGRVGPAANRRYDGNRLPVGWTKHPAAYTGYLTNWMPCSAAMATTRARSGPPGRGDPGDQGELTAGLRAIEQAGDFLAKGMEHASLASFIYQAKWSRAHGLKPGKGKELGNRGFYI